MRAFFDAAIASKGALVVIDKATGRMIGSSRFHGYDAQAGELEIGWTFLARSHWGGPYNREMKRLMLRHAFGFAARVIFVIGPQNWRSQRAEQKLGAVRVGERCKPGGRVDVVFAIDASTFESWD